MYFFSRVYNFSDVTNFSADAFIITNTMGYKKLFAAGIQIYHLKLNPTSSFPHTPSQYHFLPFLHNKQLVRNPCVHGLN